MKINEQVRSEDKKYRLVLIYMKIFQTELSQSSFHSVVKKWKDDVATANLPEDSHPSSLMDEIRKNETSRRTKITLMKQCSCSAEMGGSDRRTIAKSWTSWKTGRKQALIKKKNNLEFLSQMWKKVLR